MNKYNPDIICPYCGYTLEAFGVDVLDEGETKCLDCREVFFVKFDNELNKYLSEVEICSDSGK